MKNKIKGSVWVKMTAWVMLFVFMVIFVFGISTAVCMETYGVFAKNHAEVQEEVRKNVHAKYAVQAMANFLHGTVENEKVFADKSYRYGIIKSEEISDRVVNNKSLYKDRNFVGNVKLSELWWEQIDVSDDLYIEYEENGIFGKYWMWYEQPYRTLYASKICYDADKGKFYYQADGKFCLAQQLSVDVEILSDGIQESNPVTFIYDAEKGKYIATDGMQQNSYTEQAYDGAETDTAAQEAYRDENGVILQRNDEILEHIYNVNGVTFDEFENTSFDFEAWNWICFDGVRNIKAEELTVIDSTKMQKELFWEDGCFYLDENYTLHVEKPQESYYVVSFVDESVFSSEKAAYLEKLAGKSLVGKLMTLVSDGSTDMFVTTEILLDMAYQWKNNIWIVTIVSSLLAIAVFVFLMGAAGHRSDREEIVTMFIDRIPIEIAATVYMILIGCVLALVLEIVNVSVLSVYMCVYLLVLLSAVAYAVSLAFVLSLAVRGKTHTLWKNSLMYYIWHWCVKVWCRCVNVCASVVKHIGMIWKICLIWGGWKVIELFFMVLAAQEDYGASIVMFCLGTLAETVILMLLLIQLKKLADGGRLLAQGELSEKIDTGRMWGNLKEHGNHLNSIGEGISRAVDERMKSEHFKTELITNVSHDIKTPLTSIINYVDLLEKTQPQDEIQKEYLEVLHRQSAKLKKLIEDLIEASKASTGNLPVSMEKLEADVFLAQIIGEFEEKFHEKGLQIIWNKPEEAISVSADGRHLWRVADNLMNNIYKYAQPDSRVYINLEKSQKDVRIIFRNISKYPLNITGEELMERFVRGDSSRNTEGNGLGLSISESLMELMNADLELYVDGDLFKVVLKFPVN